MKLAADGTKEWQKLYGGSNGDVAYSIQQTSDDGYIIAGYSSSTDIADCVNQGSNDFYLLRIDQNGNVLWNRMYGGSDSDIGRSVQNTAENGFLIAGYSLSTDIPGTTNSGLNDVYIIKVDENGDL